MRAVWLSLAVLLAACGGGYTYKAYPKPPLPKPEAEMVFQEGQKVRVKMLGQNAELENAFMSWVVQGVYTQAPVYRQLPGVFVLAGKPRLKGEGFVMGTGLTPVMNKQGQMVTPEVKDARMGQIGLVVHADGTVGPEVILVYGACLRTCGEAPANLRIGTIEQGMLGLRDVLRGDNVAGVSLLH